MKARGKIGSIAGHYSLNVYKEDGCEVTEKRVGPTDNIVTDFGIQELVFKVTGDGWSFVTADAAGVVGKGSTERSASSTQLSDPFKRTSDQYNSDVSYEDNGDDTMTAQVTWKCSFEIGDFDGDTLSEIGIAKYTSDNDDLYAGQLIKDENGDETTITILDDEQLVVEYTIELTVPMAQQSIDSGTVSVDGSDVGYTIYMNPWFVSQGGGSSVRIEDADQLMRIFGSDYSELTYINGTTASINKNENQWEWHFAHVFSPSDFTSDDIKWLVFASLELEDPYTDPYKSDNEESLFILKFDTPLSKTDTDAMEVDMSITLEVVRD